jgi:hypothetical protein
MSGWPRSRVTPSSTAATRRPGQREVDQDRRALARAVVLEVGGAGPAAVGQAVLGEVQGPALVGGDRAPGARQPAAEPALLPAAAADGRLLLAVEALHELVVRPPALAAQQRVQPPVAEPAPLAGQGTQAGFTHEIASVAQPAWQRRVPVRKRGLL